MRITPIDGLRGFFLATMMLVHLAPWMESTLGHYTLHQLGWVEDAQGFVFLSGLVIGLVYGGLLLRRGGPAMRASL